MGLLLNGRVPQKASRLSLPVMVEIEQPGSIVFHAARRLLQRFVGWLHDARSHGPGRREDIRILHRGLPHQVFTFPPQTFRDAHRVRMEVPIFAKPSVLRETGRLEIVVQTGEGGESAERPIK